jgi:hypothetical protein
MYLLKSITGSFSAAVLVFGFTAAAMSMPAMPMISGSADEAPILQAQSAGQENDHPAWSFGCAQADYAIRAVPCTDPVYVYGRDCLVGTGRPDQPKPCEAKPVQDKRAEAKQPETSGSGVFSFFNPLGLFK